MKYEEILQEIAECKDALTTSDYQALKHADGALSDSEYESIKAKRQEWRYRINELETMLPEAKEQYEIDVEKEQEAEAKALEAQRAEEEARMQEEMELAMKAQEEYEKDFEALQNGEMPYEEFAEKYPERISHDEEDSGLDSDGVDFADSDTSSDNSRDDGE